MFRLNINDFSGPQYHQSRQSWKSGLYDLVLHSKLTHTILWRSSYYFLAVRLKNVSVEFWRLFRTRDLLGLAKLKIDPRWLGSAAKTYWHFSRYNSYRFPSVRLKNVLVEFWRLFRARALPVQSKLKMGSTWLHLAPETYSVCSAVLIVSCQYGWKMFRLNINDFSWPRYHLSRESWKPGPYDSILHSKLTHTIWDAILIVSHH